MRYAVSTADLMAEICKCRREMIFRILRQAQDEANHRADAGENRPSSGLILSLTKDADALTPNLETTQPESDV
jgi:hypothetical protein